MNVDPEDVVAPDETRLRIEVSGDCAPEILDLRLAQLDREWDVDRAFLAGGACAGLLGVLLGGFRNRLYLALPLAIFGFTWQRIVRGRCAPVDGLRRLGFRTPMEIQEERTALQALRRTLRRARRPKPARTRTA